MKIIGFTGYRHLCLRLALFQFVLIAINQIILGMQYYLPQKFFPLFPSQ